MPQFERYSGIDYSKGKTPSSRLPGLRFMAFTSAIEFEFYCALSGLATVVRFYSRGVAPGFIRLCFSGSYSAGQFTGCHPGNDLSDHAGFRGHLA